MARGPKKHLKRLAAPKHWMLDKLGGTWAPRPSQGPHKLRECLPLIVLLRNRLKYALTRREVVQICAQRLVKVDGKVRTDINFPAGFQDVVTIEKTNENFRLLFDTKGRYAVHRITPEEAKFKLCKVKRQQLGAKSIPLIVTHDGRTIRYPDPIIKVNDTVKLNLQTGKIEDVIKFDVGATVMVTGGHNLGRVGVLEARERHLGGFDIVHIKDATGNKFATRISNVFVIGKGKSLVSLPKGNGIRLSILQERDKKPRPKLFHSLPLFTPRLGFSFQNTKMAASQLQNPLKTPSSQLSIKKHKPCFLKPRRLTVSAAHPHLNGRKLRVAVIGGGPAGSSAAEALASGGIETFLFERSPSTAKPCGGAIPLCMVDEFSIPHHLIDRHVTKMKIISPSNLTVDFGSKSLRAHESIPMLRREVLDAFLRTRAESAGAQLIPSLVTHLEIPASSLSPYIIHHTVNNSRKTLAVDVIVGADGANSKVAKFIKAGNYTCAIAFQERIRLPDEKMEYYQNLAEMYVGNDVSPDFYAWVFPKCDHVAVGTGTVCGKQDIKMYQRGIKQRVKNKIKGGKVIKVEAHPIPEHPRPVRVRGRVALVGDAAGYVTKCSGEGIYFAAKSGRMCGEGIVRASEGGEWMISEDDLKREYLMEWDKKYVSTFRFLDLLQRVFYGSNEAREALVEVCGSEYVQRMTFDSYLYKKLAKGDRWEDLKMVFGTFGSLMRCKIVGRDMAAFNLQLFHE